MKFFLVTVILFFSCLLFSQPDSLIRSFENRKNKLNRNGLVVLASWSTANLLTSAALYATNQDYESKQFHVMNASWSIVNLGIALPSLFIRPSKNSSLFEVQKDQTKTEKIFLINTFLDVAYITGGFYLKEYSKNQKDEKQQQRFNSFGNAVIMQGSALFLFDFAMTILNNKNRKKNLDGFLKNTSFTVSSNYIKLEYAF